ncbi:unknown protein [Mesoplasma florum L1]|uniref:Uncharacterized protein n=1 Tax=Mesoplasma florum (strain ATCC 33453 / NBRC 100688 / NCTC 11704 / L1) TaxID=265311 RepID=Q6F0V3_MESFL|nr:unknown protein [Mesoplasma florum L1]
MSLYDKIEVVINKTSYLRERLSVSKIVSKIWVWLNATSNHSRIRYCCEFEISLNCNKFIAYLLLKQLNKFYINYLKNGKNVWI